MRAALVALTALTAFAPIQAEASHEVTATFYGAVMPSDDASTVSVISVCEARATRVTSKVKVTCSINDGHADPGVSETCESPGPEAVCPISLIDGIFPVTICSDAHATLADLTTDTDSRCRTYTAPTSEELS